MHHRVVASLAASLATAGITAIVACSSSSTPSGVVDQPETGTGTETGTKKPPPEDTDSSTPEVPYDPGPDPLLGCTADPGATAPTVDPDAATDPTGGAAAFTLAMALEGFPGAADAGAGKLTAGIYTEKGGIKCELFEAVAPISVANFVGLARGMRPYKNSAKKWAVGRFYDGLTWHRIIPNFVIQGGDPLGTGSGGPGYDLVKENQVVEPKGALAMAASNKVSGSQFYVVVGNGPAADYNVFGSCNTENAVAVAKVPRDDDDKPKTPIHMTKIAIARCP